MLTRSVRRGNGFVQVGLGEVRNFLSGRITGLSEKWPAETQASLSSSDLRRTLHFGFHRARKLAAHLCSDFFKRNANVFQVLGSRRALTILAGCTSIVPR